MQQQLNRGDIYIVNLPNSNGSIQNFKRPAVLISNNLANKYSGVLHICPLTSVNTKSKLPTHIDVNKNCGLLRDSVALCEQTMLVTVDVFEEKVGSCDEDTLRRIDQGIAIQFGLIQVGNNNKAYA